MWIKRPTKQLRELVLLVTVFQCSSIFAYPATANPSNRTGNATSPQKKSSLVTSPQTVQKVINLDSVYSGEYLEACIKQATANIARNPGASRDYTNRGFMQWRLERFKLAEADLERAVAISPQTATAEVYRVLGECYAEENLPTKAIANFSKAIKMNSSEKVPRPQDFRHISTVKTCYLRRAQCYAGLEKYLEAISDANKVVALNPNQSWPYELRARLNKSVGRYENVIEDCTAAIRLAPDSSSNYADRALAYEKLGKHKQAQLDKQKLNDLAEKILGP